MLSSALPLIKNSHSGLFLHTWHKILDNLDVLGKKGLHKRIQQAKSYQINGLFFLGFEKVLNLQASVIFEENFDLTRDPPNRTSVSSSALEGVWQGKHLSSEDKQQHRGIPQCAPDCYCITPRYLEANRVPASGI